MNLKIKLSSVLAIAVISILGVVALPIKFATAAGFWYVAPNGIGNCLSPVTPCASINGAIVQASAGDTIYVAAGTYTTTSGTEVVLINKDVTLSGGWDASFTSQSGMSTIDAEARRKGVNIPYGTSAIIERFIIQNGYDWDYGGAIYVGGNSLTLINSLVENNKVVRWGGGIYIDYNSVLTLTDSVVSNNRSTDGDGGGIYNWSGIVTIRQSVVNSNSVVGYGGGIYNYFGTVNISDTVIANNTAGGNGGGFSGYGSATPASFNVVNSAILNNTGACGGGSGLTGNHSLVIVNSTIAGNRAQSGGGICNNATLFNVTIANNSVTGSGGGIYGDLYGGVSMKNSILAQNLASVSSADCSGPLNSQGNNLIQDPSGCLISGSATGNITNTNPQLLALVGSPAYHPLQFGSPAIDAGNPTGCTDNHDNPLTTDQRGAVRIGDCDIGAYEYTVPGSAAGITVYQGAAQSTFISRTFSAPLQVAVLDSIGSPVSNTMISFIAPAGGASGTFQSSGTFTTTSVTSEDGLSLALTFTANGIPGKYTVSTSASGVITPTIFILTNLAPVFLPMIMR